MSVSYAVSNFDAAAFSSDLDLLPQALRAGTDMTALQDARLLRALAWWMALPRETAMTVPDRLQIDPIAIPALLPYCLLWDVAHRYDGRPRYTCRLAGTALCDMFGGEQRGLDPDRMYGAESARMQEEFDVATLLARPFFGMHRMTWADRPFYRYGRLLLPFTHRAARLHAADEPGRVDLLMSVISFVPE